MNTILKSAFILTVGSNKYDVYTEIIKTKYVPYKKGPYDPDFMFIDDRVLELVGIYGRGGGYAGLSLHEYLDGFYKPTS